MRRFIFTAVVLLAPLIPALALSATPKPHFLVEQQEDFLAVICNKKDKDGCSINRLLIDGGTRQGKVVVIADREENYMGQPYHLRVAWLDLKTGDFSISMCTEKYASELALLSYLGKTPDKYDDGSDTTCTTMDFPMEIQHGKRILLPITGVKEVNFNEGELVAK